MWLLLLQRPVEHKEKLCSPLLPSMPHTHPTNTPIQRREGQEARSSHWFTAILKPCWKNVARRCSPAGRERTGMRLQVHPLGLDPQSIVFRGCLLSRRSFLSHPSPWSPLRRTLENTPFMAAEGSCSAMGLVHKMSVAPKFFSTLNTLSLF